MTEVLLSVIASIITIFGSFIGAQMWSMNRLIGGWAEKHSNHESRLDNHEGRIHSLEVDKHRNH